MASGEYIVHHGIPAHDIYTYTASDFPWVHHEWLADSINYLITTVGGTTLLAIVFAGLWTGAVALAAKRLTLRSTVVAVVAVLSMFGSVTVRDVAWTVFFFALLPLLYEKKRWLIPLLFVVWANFHGGFVIGLVYLAWRIIRYRDWRGGAVLALSAVATLVNPYGLEIYREIGATLLDSSLHSRIDEWQSWHLAPESWLFIGLWLGTLGCDLYKRRPLSLVGFDTLLFVAALLSSRHYLLFVIAALPRVIDQAHQLRFRSLFRNHRLTIRHIIKTAATYTTALLGMALFLVSTVAVLQPSPHDNRAAVVASLRQTPCTGNLFNDYNLGGYLIKNYPEQKIYIDGRMPSWEHGGVKYMDNYLRALKDPAFRAQEFARYDIRCVVLSKQSDTVEQLVKDGWQIDVRGDYVLLRR